MKTYIITYDLKESNNGYNYMLFYDAIKSLKNWEHFCEAAWFVKSNLTANEIFNILKPTLDNNSLLFVTEINIDNKAGWIHKNIWPWLNNNE